MKFKTTKQQLKYLLSKFTKYDCSFDTIDLAPDTVTGKEGRWKCAFTTQALEEV